MKMKESYYRLVLRHFLKYPNEMLNTMNDDCEEEYEKLLVMLLRVKSFTCEELGSFTTFLNSKCVVKPTKELVL
ncbi:hypothetical protein [Priestia megaterium]|uniref:hypothetical protein n=1 Tax=Priestia megaterium TaxID=1404 RepID=UPI0023DA7657|nr:hypothetical protein [Priestia megaterium]MDF2052638.1 hypothetical protein [Priestia megaterium]MDF2058760.1 hypothetical protein [Priestia megaterium]